MFRFHRSAAFTIPLRGSKVFSGPIGSGKSQALCQEAIRLSYLNAGRQGLIGAPTYPMLRDATLTSFLEVVGGSRIPYELNKSESVLVMKDTGSRIYFRAVDDFERLRGTNLAWFGLDELTYTPEESWLRLEGRLRDPLAKRLCGFAVWTPKVSTGCIADSFETTWKGTTWCLPKRMRTGTCWTRFRIFTIV